MHADMVKCVQHCPTCQRDQTLSPLMAELQWIDKGDVPFAGWSVDAAGPFPKDADGNRYLLIAVDPFSKWVELRAVSLLHSWRAAEFLYDELVARWGKPRWVRMDNGSEFAGDFAAFCKAAGIVQRCISVGNSKANG